MLGKQKGKLFIFIVDGVSAANSDKLKNALKAVDIITNVKIDLQRGLLEVGAKRNPELQVKMACELVGCTLRTEVKKRQI